MNILSNINYKKMAKIRTEYCEDVFTDTVDLKVYKIYKCIIVMFFYA